MELDQAKELINQSNKILVFSGAGISKESGIPTFRDADGIWKDYDPLFWGTRTGLLANYIFNVKKFSKFFIGVVEPIIQALPNKGHLAIKNLEKNKEVFIFTQNIDNLHQDAGSTNVTEVHGNIFEILSKNKVIQKLTKEQFNTHLSNLKLAKTKKEIRAVFKNIFNFKKKIRPNVVLFSEGINQKAYDNAINFADKCDCLIIVGTSLRVYPAANIARRVNKMKIINIGYDSINSVLNVKGNASKILPLLVN